jgi:hypothetical protein
VTAAVVTMVTGMAAGRIAVEVRRRRAMRGAMWRVTTTAAGNIFEFFYVELLHLFCSPFRLIDNQS